ncbi:hypothetical protein LINPERPRIM_LOCUS11595 [Linum perenne]
MGMSSLLESVFFFFQIVILAIS